MTSTTSQCDSAQVLIIDDDEAFCYMLTQLMEHLGHTAVCAHLIKDGIKQAETHAFDLIFLDVNLPDGSGLDILQDLKGIPSRPEIIIVTSKGELDGAELAIRNGVWDYIPKPSSLKEITLPFVRALEYRKEKQANFQTKPVKVNNIIGKSAVIQELIDRMAQAARSSADVLITGETGTGKEIFAQAVHENSPRADNNFTVVDCGAMPENLVESMLFGHRKGAFTGASSDRPGLLLQADGGTLFLDEVGELPLNLQKAFLRAIQERRFRPIGSKDEVESDFRLIAATNRDLDEMVFKGEFRSDLLFRLRGFPLDLPALRRRKEDILELVMFHAARTCKRAGKGIKGMAPEFMDALMAYPWPGNVRELFQSLEMALIVADDVPTLYPFHLPPHIRIRLSEKNLENATPTTDVNVKSDPPENLPPLKDYRSRLVAEGETRYLMDLMSITRGNIEQALKISGVGKARLYALLKQYGITRP